jgi:hypothetical protein
LIRLRVPVPIPIPVPPPDLVAMAAVSVVSNISRPLPTFSEKKKEEVQVFIDAINFIHEREAAVFETAEIAAGAKRSLLLEGCQGKAASFLRRLPQDRKDTWEKLVTELRAKYEAPNVQDQAKAVKKAMKFKQRHDEELLAYARRAKKIARRIDPAWEQMVASRFVEGIRNRNLRTIVAAYGQKSDCTFQEVYEATKSVARARKHGTDSDSDTSDSDSGSDPSDSASSGSSRHGSSRKKAHHGDSKRNHSESKRAQSESKDKGKGIEIRPPPVVPAVPAFNMEELAKAVADALQTRSMAAANPFHL